MKLNVIQCELNKDSQVNGEKLKLLSRGLELASAEDLATEQQRLTSPTVWVVMFSVPDELWGKFPTLLDEPKEKPKNSTIELKRLLIPGDKISAVKGGYEHVGRLRSSIEKFLARKDTTSHRLFIIGVADDIFSKLEKEAVREPVHASGSAVVACSAWSASVLLEYLKDVIVPNDLRNKYLGDAPEVEEVRRLIIRAADFDSSTVLITGDTGTGKEIVAREIHHNSKRSKNPFIAVNCGAISPGLFESELFGHVRGAFNDAKVSRDGLWKTAGKGVLFLDEIGELSLDLQAKILRALQENRIRPVGADNEIAVEARVIAATNRNLHSMVENGTFREDLYFRLRGFRIRTPALRDHPTDIPMIARKLWVEIAGEKKPVLEQGLLDMLCRYMWPGNVREMRMVLNYLNALFFTKSVLDAQHLLQACKLQGIEMPLADEPKSRVTIRHATLSSIRHLQLVFEVIKAVEHFLEPVRDTAATALGGGEALAVQLGFLSGELQQLSRKPALFTPQTFDSISLLRSKLAYFIGCLQDQPEVAVAFWREQGQSGVDTALLAVLGETESLLNSLRIEASWKPGMMADK